MGWRFFNKNGRHVRCTCPRCGWQVWVPAEERQLDPAPVICTDCQAFLERNQAIAEREFQAAIRRSEQDSIDMRARWARQDAAQKAKAS